MLGETLSLGCALSWGVSVILFKQSEGVSPQSVNLFKTAFASVLLGATLLATGGSLPRDRSLEDWMRLLGSGVLGLAVADTLFLVALRRLGAGMMAILDCLYAPLVALLSVLILGEKIGRGFAAGSALVLLGILAATTDRQGIHDAAALARGHLGSVLIGVSGIAVIAIAIVIAKPALERADLVEATFTRTVGGGVALVAVLLLRRDRRETFRVFAPQPVWRHLVPASFLGTYVAILLWLGGMKYTSASIASILNQLSVVFTLLLARVVLHEPLSARRLLGGSASLAGALVIVLAANAS